MKTIKSIIVAVDENNGIGRNNGLLCYLPNDLKHFKSITSGHTVIMGRNTFDSLPNGALPNRRNIVITRSTDVTIPNCEVCYSIGEALNRCEGEKEVFFIGGGIIYKSVIEIADIIYLTQIHHRFEDADTYFPEILSDKWSLISEEYHKADERNIYDYSFLEFRKIIR